MATRILGVDLGAYSVKVAVVTPGFRHAALADFVERPVPPGDEPHEVRARRVLGQIIREKRLEDDTAFCAVPGDQVFLHVLEFSFRNLRRQQMEQAVGGELEGELPLDLEDMVYTFEKLPDDLGVTSSAGDGQLADGHAAAGDDDPTFVQGEPIPSVVHGRIAEPTEGMRLLACAMRLERASELMDAIEALGIEARGLLAAPASYARPAQMVPGLAGDKSNHESYAVVDIGHARTDLCVIRDGRVVFARSIGRGGRDVTEAIARTWRLSSEDAENAKHTDGFVASTAQPASSEAWQRIHEVIVAETGGLARDLRQSLSACRAKTGAMVSRVLLVGGGSRLRGLSDYLADRLRIPVRTMDGDEAAAIVGPGLASAGVADVGFLAAGVAFEGASGRPAFDLRQGELAFKADLSFLRAKAASLATAVLVVVAFAALNAYASLHKLRKAEKALDERLAVETTAAFGQSLSADDTLVRTGGLGTGGTSDSPLPRMTAYDVLLDINSRLPSAEDVTLDVLDIDIKAGKVTMKATTGVTEKYDAVKGSTELVKKLKEQECFEEVTRGNLSAGADDSRNFPVTIKANCK